MAVASSDIRVLYIEDEPALCDLFTEVVEDLGFGVDVAMTGQDGLASFAAHSHDIVAIDHHLPDMLGLDIARQLLEQNPGLPVMMITGRGNEQTAAEAVSLGVSSYVIKGSSPDIYTTIIPGTIQTLANRGIEIRRRRAAEAALRESEERFRDFAELGADWFWEMGPDLRFTYLSPRVEEVLGVPPAAHMGKTRLEMAGASTENGKWHKHQGDLKERIPFTDFRYEREMPGGGRIHISASGKPIFDDEGNFAGYRGIGTDLTRQMEAEEALRLALTDAEEANQAKSDFLATMSHELRTPLNAIIGFSEMIKGQFFGALGSTKYEEYADDIRTSSEHLLALVNDILDLSVIEAGQQILNFEELEVADVAADCSPIIESSARKKEIDYRVDIPAGIPAVRADRRSLKQILFNVLSNAVKFTPQGGEIAFRISATSTDHVFEIQDNGIGVRAEKLPSLTEPFVRTESDPLVAQEGTGLGLAIVKSLVDLHAGRLTIKSSLGEGTCVTIKIPRQTR